MPFIPAWFDDLRLPPRQLSIAIHIARRGDCYESSRGIAAHCQISRNTVLKELKNLIEIGVICEVKNGSSRPSYRLCSHVSSGTRLNQNGTTLSHSNGTTLNQGGTTLNQGGTRLSQNGSNQIPKGTTPKEGTPSKVHRKSPSSRLSRKLKFSEESKEVLAYLNEQAGKRFSEIPTHLKEIQKRLDEKDVSVDGLRELIDSKVRSWKGDPKMDTYLRPSTLFKSAKFWEYYDLRNVTAPKDGRPREKQADELTFKDYV